MAHQNTESAYLSNKNITIYNCKSSKKYKLSTRVKYRLKCYRYFSYIQNLLTSEKQILPAVT